MPVNRTVTLAARPGDRVAPTDLKVVVGDIPSPADGTVLLRNRYLSVDPGIRNLLGAQQGYLPPVPVGAAMTGAVLGEVVESRHPAFAAGDIMLGRGALAEYAVITPGPLSWKVDTDDLPDLSLALGALGIPGLTAYFGLVGVGQPQAGETVLVSSAAGAVGSLAAQIARNLGCRTVGIAGGSEKCAYLQDELGLDAAIDYRGKDPAALREAIATACPDGVDVFFDNVGGATLDAALAVMNSGGRISLCGMVSQYDTAQRHPFANLFQIIAKSVTLRGFLLFEFVERYSEGLAALRRWVEAGQLQLRQTIRDGLDEYPAAFAGLFQLNTPGKTVVRLEI